MTAAKSIVGVGAGLLAAIFLAFLKAEVKILPVQVAVGIGGGLATVGYGIYLFRQLGRIHREYVGSLQLYRLLKQFRPFIERYRAALR
jgi:hypothetical protein